jgi:hypothetical protein
LFSFFNTHVFDYDCEASLLLNRERRIKSESLFSIIDSFTTKKETHREDESSSTIDKRIDANQKEFNE